MSETDINVIKMLLFLGDDRWNNSIESLAAQKRMRLTKSESLFKIPFRLDSNATFSERELREIRPENSNFIRDWELVKDKYSPTQTSKNFITDELEILKINQPFRDDDISSRTSALTNDVQKEGIKNKIKTLTCWTNLDTFVPGGPCKLINLLAEIERSDLAKTDTVIWKFLKRGLPFRKEIFKGKKFSKEVRTFKLSDPYIQNTKPTRLTCPNCNFFVTTYIKKVHTMYTTRLFAMFLTAVGLCVVPHIYYSYKDTVHICPLCKIYLGFCPAFGIWSKRKMIRALKPQEIKSLVKVESMKMVSASSTSAKNLFVESKLRLSDRVQVNVNNIAAIARQIQRGSKANEDLIGAAKNFALQEPAIDNSETNLKKLKLLTTHINNQLDSIHNSSMKMESVLEQVRSMQR